MNALTRTELWEAAKVAFDEGQFGSLDQAKDWVLSVEREARKLHRLYTKACNVPLTDADERATSHLEAVIKAEFLHHGLGLYLNGDPRGNPVGILTPKTGRYNTMGGAECGWRL